MKARPLTGINNIIQKQRSQAAAQRPPTKYEEVMKALGRTIPQQGTYNATPHQPPQDPRIKSKTITAPTLKAKTIGVKAPPKRTAPTLKEVLESQAENQ